VSQDVTLPVLHAEDARIAVDDVVAIEQLTVRTRGDRVLCAGDTEVLFAALTGVPLRSRSRLVAEDDMPGEASVIAGSLFVAGHDVGTGDHFGVVGAAPVDVPLPAKMTALEYVTWSARLAGQSPAIARELAMSALEQVGLAGAYKRDVSTLDVAGRRVLALAHAASADPDVIIVELPLAGLEAGPAAFVMNAISRVTEKRKAIFSVRKMDPGTPEGNLALGASDVLVFASGSLVMEATPEELFASVRVYGVTIRKNAGAFRDELEARGAVVRGGPLRMSVTLPDEATTKEILAAASKARAPIVEMFPIVGGSA
jgi:ABC-2 type transport system ATP-binding protein